MILVTHFLFFVPIGPFSYVLSHIASDKKNLVSGCQDPPVSLDIALSLCKVSKHLGKAFIPSVRFENFNFFRLFRALRKRA